MRKVALLSVLALAVSAGFAVADSTVVVSPSNSDGWAFDIRDGNTGDLLQVGPNALTNFVNGPATPPLGTGSAELSTPTGKGSDDSQIRNTNYNNVALSTITSLNYWTYDKANNGQQFPFLGLVISTDGKAIASDDSNLDTIFFEPPYQQPSTGNPSLPDQGAPVLDQWQSWNALEGGWWDNNGNFNPGADPGGVGSWADILALFPDATIVNTIGSDGSTVLGGVRIDAGDASDIPGQTFDGFVDDVTIGVSNVNTTFNFELNPTVPLPASAWSGLALLGGLGLLGGVKRMRQQMV